MILLWAFCCVEDVIASFEFSKMAKLKFIPGKQWFSTLTSRYYPDYDSAFQDSLREGGGASSFEPAWRYRLTPMFAELRQESFGVVDDSIVLICQVVVLDSSLVEFLAVAALGVSNHTAHRRKHLVL